MQTGFVTEISSIIEKGNYKRGMTIKAKDSPVDNGSK